MTRPAMTAATPRVVATRTLTPHMRRITLGGDDLAAFRSVAPDQQLKLFFARDGGVPRVPEPEPDGDVMRWYTRYLAIPEAQRPWMRTYSVRAHRPEADELDIDFVLHDDDGSGSAAGPASLWAALAQVGDPVGLYGPAVSHFGVADGAAARVMLGDETALPAIAATLEALPSSDRAVVFVEVADAAEEQPLTCAADVTVHWLHRDGVPAGRSTVLLDALRAAALPSGPLFGWVAGEASAVRAIRRHLVGERGMPKRAVAFTGYWRCDLAQDADPTPADLADQAEVAAELEAARAGR